MAAKLTRAFTIVGLFCAACCAAPWLVPLGIGAGFASAIAVLLEPTFIYVVAGFVVAAVILFATIRYSFGRTPSRRVSS
jgi:hypothetical protein